MARAGCRLRRHGNNFRQEKDGSVFRDLTYNSGTNKLHGPLPHPTFLRTSTGFGRLSDFYNLLGHYWMQLTWLDHEKLSRGSMQLGKAPLRQGREERLGG